MNNISLVGRITTDLELKTVKDKKVLNFNLAVKRVGTEETDFIPVVVWGTKAENTEKYTGKGKLVAVQGELRTGTYEKDGQKRTKFEIIADFIQYLDKKSE